MSQSKPVTLRDIAAQLNVSLMTVSLALRDDPRITPARRKLVRETAERLNYQPNAMAVALARQRSETAVPGPVRAELAWLNHWQDPARLSGYHEFARMWTGARAAAESLGYRLIEFIVDRRMSFARLDQVLSSRGISGVLVPPHGGGAVTSPDQHSLDWSRYAVVRIGYSIPGLPAHMVVNNHTQGALLACTRIAAKGYRRLGYVCAPASSVLSRAGYLTYQADHPESETLPILFLPDPGSTVPEVRVARLQAWLEAHRPQAILTEIADLRTLLTRLGHRVPEDIALASTSIWDGNVDAGLEQHSNLVGTTAVHVLVDLMQRHELGFPAQPREVLVPSSWQDGATLPPAIPAAA